MKHILISILFSLTFVKIKICTKHPIIILVFLSCSTSNVLIQLVQHLYNRGLSLDKNNTRKNTSHREDIPHHGSSKFIILHPHSDRSFQSKIGLLRSPSIEARWQQRLILNLFSPPMINHLTFPRRRDKSCFSLNCKNH